MPVTFSIPTGRDSHFAPSSERGIAIGSTDGSNGATLVLIPGRGLKPFPRADVQRLNLPPPTESLTITTDALLPTITESTKDDPNGSVLFHSSPSTAISDLMSTTDPIGTLGFHLFPDVHKSTQPTIPLKKEKLPGHIPPPRMTTRQLGLQEAPILRAVAASAQAMASKRIQPNSGPGPQVPTLAQLAASDQ